MTIEEMLEAVDEGHLEGAATFPPEFNEAIQGLHFAKDESGRLVPGLIYSRQGLMECLMQQNPDWSDLDAEEWIDYNMSRTADYLGAQKMLILDME